MKKISLEQFLKNCIETMRNAGVVDMRFYQFTPGASFENVKTSTEELHLCNTPACFAGWVAVSDWWKELGGSVSSLGEPLMLGYANGVALASVIEDEDFTLMIDHLDDIIHCNESVFGNMLHADIRAEHVIEALQRWFDTGSPYLESSK